MAPAEPDGGSDREGKGEVGTKAETRSEDVTENVVELR